jgi:hypothetical protein
MHQIVVMRDARYMQYHITRCVVQYHFQLIMLVYQRYIQVTWVAIVNHTLKQSDHRYLVIDLAYQQSSRQPVTSEVSLPGLTKGMYDTYHGYGCGCG